MLSKTFDPAAIEARWYAHWEEAQAFRPHRPTAQPFTICLPPPNVTGTLHIGHALNQTLQDILIRWQRMQGRDARWIVGTDHAGIATQMVVERTLAAEGQTRQQLGRDAFLQKVWDWKAESGGAITRQMRRLGASCDWAHERFTMDAGLSAAVTHVFVTLHERGLIYRDKRLVNWDPKFRTAISDLEVENREIQGHFWHLRYPLADGSGHLVVATTRPETMLGDTAVAVNPEDERYQHLIGKMVAHPLTSRQIPVIADEWADPELGSGVVKITPAHDFNDWAVYERHKDIGWINILDEDARIVDSSDVPAAYRGLDRFEARKRIIADLDALGLLEQIEDKLVQVPHGDRSGVVIEPFLTDQWYVNAAHLAKQALAAVDDGRTKFVPQSWRKTYDNWLTDIQPWCISRQLWWGHRIPVWYGYPLEQLIGRIPVEGIDTAPEAFFVARSVEHAVSLAKEYYQKYCPNRDIFIDVGETSGWSISENSLRITIAQDEDVLDTWFSSGLWPFATLGWPEQTEDFARHYPTDVLVTAFDIIFFWVARMMMQGLELTGDVPFRTVYIHGLVRDAAGQKMSKSRGNTVDPLDMVDRYGADALRFTLAALESQGRDVKFDEKRVEGYRNFATKLWNAVRFCQMQGIKATNATQAPNPAHPVNRWIVNETARMVSAATQTLQAYRYDQYCTTSYRFTWDLFCDWYVELAKPLLAENSAYVAETRETAAFVIDSILKVLHPVMPFITEELWHALGDRPHDLILAEWPVQPIRLEPAADEIFWLIDLVSAIRSARTELNVPPSARLPLHIADADALTTARLGRHMPALERLARVSAIEPTAAPAGGSAQLVVDGLDYALPLAGVIDLDAERARLLKAAETAEKDAASLAQRLANPGFTERAKPEAVEKARTDHEARTAEAARFRAALARLG